MPSPPCCLTAYFPQSLHEWTVMGKMFRATTVIAVLLLHLGILYSPCQVHHKLFSNPISSVGIITPFVLILSSVFFLLMCQMHNWHFWDRLVALEFLQGGETGSSLFWNIISHLSPWVPEQLHGIFLLCFLGSPQIIRIGPYLWTCLQIGYHCFQVLGEPPIEAVSL